MKEWPLSQMSLRMRFLIILSSSGKYPNISAYVSQLPFPELRINIQVVDCFKLVWFVTFGNKFLCHRKGEMHFIDNRSKHFVAFFWEPIKPRLPRLFSLKVRHSMRALI